MKKNYFSLKALLMMCFLSISLSGFSESTVKVGSADDVTNSIAQFTTIQAAYNSLTEITDAVVIELLSGYSPESETYPISFAAITGASDVNTITIKPAIGIKKTLANPNLTKAVSASISNTTSSLTLDNVAGLTTASYVAGNYVYTAGIFKQLESVDELTNTITFASGTFINAANPVTTTFFIGAAQTQTISFNGAKHVIIDGVSKTGDTGLTIANPNAIYAHTILFTGNTEFVTVKNCIIKGANQTGAWQSGYNGTLFFNGSHDILITGNDICDMGDGSPYPVAAFQMTGSGVNYSNTVSENNIFNISNIYASTSTNSGFFQFGSTSNTGSHSNKILNNKMYFTGTSYLRSGSNVVGVGIGSGMNGLNNQLEGNVIGYSNAIGTGTALIDMTGTSGTFKAVSNLKNFTLKNNTIANIEMIGGTTLSGIEFGTSNVSTPNADDVCFSNTVKDIKLTTSGNGTLQAFLINVANPYHFNVKANTARNLTIETTNGNNTLNIYGFQYTGTYVAGNSYKYIGNEVSNLSCGLGATPSTKAGNIYGIRANIADMIEGNLIYNLNANIQGYIRGLRLEGNNSHPIVVQNNIVRLGTDVTGNGSIIALQWNSTSVMKLYHNTIYIGGQCAADAPVTLVSRIMSFFTGSPTLTMQNNIFSNKRSGGASLNSILLTSAGKVAVSDHNLYEYNGEFISNGTPHLDFSSWKTAFPLLEDGSLDNLDPHFADATGSTPDMHLSTGTVADAAGIDLLSLVSHDFYGSSRADLTPSDLGAVAYFTTTDTEHTSVHTLSIFSDNNKVIINGLSGKSINFYSVNGQLIQSVTANADRTEVTMPKGLYIAMVDGRTVKVMVK